MIRSAESSEYSAAVTASNVPPATPRTLCVIGSLEVPTKAVNSLDILSAVRCFDPDGIILAMREGPDGEGRFSPAVEAVRSLKLKVPVSALAQSAWSEGRVQPAIPALAESVRKELARLKSSKEREIAPDIEEFERAQTAREVYSLVFEASLKDQNGSDILEKLRVANTEGEVRLLRLAQKLGIDPSGVKAAVAMREKEAARRSGIINAVLERLSETRSDRTCVLCDLALKPALRRAIVEERGGRRNRRVAEYWEDMPIPEAPG